MIIFKDEYGNLLEFSGFLGVRPNVSRVKGSDTVIEISQPVQWELVLRANPNAPIAERLVLFSGEEAEVRKFHKYVVDEIEGIVYGKRPFGIVELPKPVNLGYV